MQFHLKVHIVIFTSLDDKCDSVHFFLCNFLGKIDKNDMKCWLSFQINSTF